jgi:hypothetical protein
MRNVRLIGGVLALALLASTAGAQVVYKDTKLGISFKPPKDYKAIPVDPTERVTLVKYQAEQADHSADGGGGGYNCMVKLSFFPKGKFVLTQQDDGSGDGSGDGGATGKDDGKGDDGSGGDASAADPLADFVASLKDVQFSKFNCTKQKAMKLGNAPAVELSFESTDSPLSYYCLVVQQDDGLYEFQGSSLAQRFARNSADFSASAKSFKRIDRVEDKAKQTQVSQMDEQDRFLQAQIDKLPPGWSHVRTKRYMFLFDADKGFVQELEDRIEAMRDQYEKDYPPTAPITSVSIVRVCASLEEYRGYGGPASTGGYWNPVARELVVFNYPPKEFTLAVINHEAFHQYIFYFYGELSPHSWYNEGTGDYYAGAKLSKSNKVQGFGEAPGGIGRTQDIKEGARLFAEGKSKSDGAAAPLKQLMHFHQSEYYGSEGYDPALCYAEGWSIVIFLRQGKGLDPKWQRILPDYLKALLAARDEIAKDTMDKAIAKADKDEPGSSAKLPHDVKEWYGRVNEEKVQDKAFDTTFSDWTDDDWKAFQDAWLKYVSKI